MTNWVRINGVTRRRARGRLFFWRNDGWLGRSVGELNHPNCNATYRGQQGRSIIRTKASGCRQSICSPTVRSWFDRLTMSGLRFGASVIERPRHRPGPYGSSTEPLYLHGAFPTPNTKPARPGRTTPREEHTNALWSDGHRLQPGRLGASAERGLRPSAGDPRRPEHG